MRLSQHSDDCQNLPTQTKCSLKAAWSSWATVVQPVEGSHLCPKMKRHKLLRRLYRCDHLLEFRLPSAMPALVDAPGNLPPPLGDFEGGHAGVIGDISASQDMELVQVVCRLYKGVVAELWGALGPRARVEPTPHVVYIALDVSPLEVSEITRPPV